MGPFWGVPKIDGMPQGGRHLLAETLWVDWDMVGIWPELLGMAFWRRLEVEGFRFRVSGPDGLGP